MIPRTALTVALLLTLGCTARASTASGGPEVADVAIPDEDVFTPGVDAGATASQDVVTPDDPCASATTCGACASRSSCGWCDDQCSLGTREGPAGRVCQRTAWAWTTGACSAPITDSGINNPLISSTCQACAVTDCLDEATRCLADTTCQQCLSSAITPCLPRERRGLRARRLRVRRVPQRLRRGVRVAGPLSRPQRAA